MRAPTTTAKPLSSTPRRPRTLLQPRDLQVLEALVLGRCLSTTQLGRLFFPLKGGLVSPRARLRMAQLAALGLVRSIEQPQTRLDGRKAKVHFPTEKGRLLVASELGHDPRDLPRAASAESSWSFLEHTLLCNEVRVLATLGAHASSIRLLHWLPDYALRALHMRAQGAQQGAEKGGVHTEGAIIVPDGQWEVAAGASHHRFFLEADRGTIPAVSSTKRRDWRDRVALYLAAERSGFMASLYGGHRFRVLTVVPTAARLASLKAATEEAGGKGRFWFAVGEDLSPEVFYTGEVWEVAGKTGRSRLLW